MQEKLIAKILEYLESTEAFLKAELPPFFEEALSYYFWSAFIVLMVCLIMFVIGVYLIIKSLTELKEQYPDGWAYGMVSIGFLMMLLSFLVGTFKVNQIMKVTLAPKLYLIDEFRGRR